MAPAQPVPSYEFAFDPVTRRMRTTVRGFWTAEIVEAFLRGSLAAAQAAGRVHPHFDTLVDAHDFPVQSAQITETIGAAMRGAMESNPGRTAIVSRSHLGKMQGQRLYQNPRLKHFLNEQDAIAWLNAAP